MKLKYFLRGLGVGMVVTALVLCIAYRNSSSGKSVVEQAKELGMVFPQGTSEPDVTATPESENTKKPKSTSFHSTGCQALHLLHPLPIGSGTDFHGFFWMPL